MNTLMKKGITAGAFDLLHTGHVLMLEEARQYCDYLIVALQTDPTIDRPEKNKPIQSVFERFFQLKACRYVDEIIPYNTEQDLYNLLCAIKPDIRIIGEEYRDKHFTGKDLSMEIYYNSRKHPYSSSELRKRL